jgi:uncharacterized SAM-binding protein YcdF (DUF218 family)
MPARLLVEDDGPRKADAIVVLGGDAYGQRIIKGAELEKAGYAPIVLVSGPPYLLGAESDEVIEYAKRQGFPAALFRSVPLPAGSADSTRVEAIYFGKYLKDNGIHKVLLVTSNYHTRRAAKLWRLEDPWLDVTVVPAPDRYFTTDGWWESRQGKKTFLYEWVKTLATWLGD